MDGQWGWYQAMNLPTDWAWISQLRIGILKIFTKEEEKNAYQAEVGITKMHGFLLIRCAWLDIESDRP